MIAAERNLAIVRAAYVAAEHRDVVKALASATETTRLHLPPSMPFGGVYCGIEAILGATQLIFGAWDDFKPEILGYAVDGDHVVVRILARGVRRSTGEPFEMPLIEIWKLINGVTTDIWMYYFDAGQMAEFCN